ncbi:DUF342 domain-containing protein [Bordetella genomosp. 1]|uniref:Flagellar Assembly Protein A N-terminal region domain-containing protein n=1 Tax=Bordetella genomosp. 1 TaxID=1395607 RepID=A0ABX4F590_9BORD|nr:FapA family protein [Bordetella genomosp. 1]OZI68932.1 hypothetical protein CAL27_05605 [Bordetella genomosp. 1]
MSVETAFRLELDETTHALSAVFEPLEGDSALSAPTLDMLVQAIEDRGWNADVLDQVAAIGFIERCRSATELVQGKIGEVTNGSFELEISPDHMSVLLVVVPAKGGTAIEESAVLAALIEHGVVYGVHEASIRQALALGTRATAVVAQGTPPTAGTPVRFESLLDALKTRQQEDDENAPIDYRELGNLTLVAPGTPLMRRIPPVQGKPGLNVLGEAVEPVQMPDTPFASNLTGVSLDEEDANLLRAANAGSPMVVPQGVLVNSLVEVDAVDLNTGNINFDGTLRVRGDIVSGMEVRVSGDVVVNGTIEAALVHAGGNVSVNGGIIGLAEIAKDVRPTPGAAPSIRTAQITAGGSVKARFIENALVNADKNIAAEREVRASRVYAGESVTVGPPASQMGVIVGGEAHATKSVSAGTMGSLAGVPTQICVGLHPHAEARRAALEARRAGLTEEKNKLEKLIVFLHNNPAKNVNGMSDRARATHHRVTADLAQVEVEEVALQKDLQPLLTATIIASRRYHSGVHLQIGNKVQEIFEDTIGGKAMLEEGQLVIKAAGTR